LELIKARCEKYINDKTGLVLQTVIQPEGCFSNGLALLRFKKGAFYPMKPIKIICFKWKSRRYNMSNIAISALFSRVILALDIRREVEIFEFDPFDPAKIGLTESKDWQKFADITKNVMCKVL